MGGGLKALAVIGIKLSLMAVGRSWKLNLCSFGEQGT
jgi:hypothetical protein